MNIEWFQDKKLQSLLVTSQMRLVDVITNNTDDDRYDDSDNNDDDDNDDYADDDNDVNDDNDIYYYDSL